MEWSGLLISSIRNKYISIYTNICWYLWCLHKPTYLFRIQWYTARHMWSLYTKYLVLQSLLKGWGDLNSKKVQFVRWNHSCFWFRWDDGGCQDVLAPFGCSGNKCCQSWKLSVRHALMNRLLNVRTEFSTPSDKDKLFHIAVSRDIHINKSG